MELTCVPMGRFGLALRFGRLRTLAQVCASASPAKLAGRCASLRWATPSLAAQRPSRGNKKSLGLSRLESSSLGGGPKFPIGGYECFEAEWPFLRLSALIAVPP